MRLDAIGWGWAGEGPAGQRRSEELELELKVVWVGEHQALPHGHAAASVVKHV